MEDRRGDAGSSEGEIQQNFDGQLSMERQMG